MSEIKLSKDADALVCALYKSYCEKRKLVNREQMQSGLEVLKKSAMKSFPSGYWPMLRTPVGN